MAVDLENLMVVKMVVLKVALMAVRMAVSSEFGMVDP